MTQWAKGWKRRFSRRYPGPVGFFILLLAFEVVSYSQRYLTGTLDGVPLELAVTMHASRGALLALFVVRPHALEARAGTVFTFFVAQILIMSSLAGNADTTVYLVAVISGLSVLFASFCPVWQGAIVAGIAGASVALAVYPADVATPLAISQSAFAGAIFAVSPAAVAWFRHRLLEARARAERLADTDALTGLFNRRGVIAHIPGLLSDARERGSQVVAMAVDLDHFKAVNDAHGHAVGDLVLADAARALSACLRQADVVSRIGGEEFLALFATTAESVVDLAERVRRAIPEATTPHAVTVSIGVAAAVPPAPGEIDAVEWVLKLVDEADRLLYDAKGRGRDRVQTG